jgi:hypothetical protein
MFAYRYAGQPVKLYATNEDFFIEKEGKFLCRVKKSEVQKAKDKLVSSLVKIHPLPVSNKPS